MKLYENKHLKVLRSENYNYNFNKENGFFCRWGKTLEDDPIAAPFPEILDIEVTTICNNGCKFCYKGNTLNGKNMSFETFKSILERFALKGENGEKIYSISQTALGADSSATSNPDLFPMMEYARSVGIIPNITVANISDETADKLAAVCGAVAVSRYSDKNKCYDSVKKLTDRGMKQINIHFMISKETLEQAYETIDDIISDSKLEKLNALVLLSLKPKGRGTSFNKLTQEEFTKLVKYAFEKNVRLGADSCSANKMLKALVDHPNYEQIKNMVEPCESFGLFSSYINVDGKYFPCSFCEQAHEDWNEGIDVLSVNSIVDIWNSPLVNKWRDISLKANRDCVIYDV
jgi:MoaA/NifB/PqqE/SkfB family radical SAM enzyme